MQTGTEQALDLKPGSRGRTSGRKDKDGIEQPIKVKPLKDECPRLMRLLRRAKDAHTEYREALNKVCEANGANTSDVNRLLKSSLIFEEVGEISDAGA